MLNIVRGGYSHYMLTPFGKIVVKAMTDQDISKSQLAKDIGTSPQYLSYILHGLRSGEKYIQEIMMILHIDNKM